MIDFVSAAHAESARFRFAVTAIGEAGAALGDVAVPACPEWTAADLTWHLTEVQAFWATMLGKGLSTPAEADMPGRPPDDQLIALFAEQSDRLITALSEGEDNDRCWSWHPAGGTRGWVRRRQAQEALIHRVDAEQALLALTGTPPSEVDESLAADGIDELIHLLLTGEPREDGARFEPSDRSVRITVPRRSWDLTIGRVTGGSADHPPDRPAVRLEPDPLASPSATVVGSAAEIDLWLWGRVPLTTASIRGNHDVVAELLDLASGH